MVGGAASAEEPESSESQEILEDDVSAEVLVRSHSVPVAGSELGPGLCV